MICMVGAGVLGSYCQRFTRTKHFPESKTLPRIFWDVLFLFWDVFGFWEVFVPISDHTPFFIS